MLPSHGEVSQLAPFSPLPKPASTVALELSTS
jgi:hypothetical protein